MGHLRRCYPLARELLGEVRRQRLDSEMQAGSNRFPLVTLHKIEIHSTDYFIFHMIIS